MGRIAAVLTLLAATGLGAPGAAIAADERPVAVVRAPDSPVRLGAATILTPSSGPPVLIYAATNTSDAAIDEFTVIAFVFDAGGTLKARQMAPARRTLDAHATKYSTLVLDGSPVAPTDIVVAGVNQAQALGADTWWRANLQSAAEAAAARKQP